MKGFVGGRVVRGRTVRNILSSHTVKLICSFEKFGNLFNRVFESKHISVNEYKTLPLVSG
jgi:hypothetical protein